MKLLPLIILLPFLAGCYTPSDEERQTFLIRQIAVSELRQAAALERIADALSISASTNERSIYQSPILEVQHVR